MQGIDVFVSTSEYETFGMSICEAMASGKPVAAYSAYSVKEVVGDSGLICETGDLTSLTAAVERLVHNPQLRHRLGQAGQERVAKQFDPRNSFQQLLSIYQSLVPATPSVADQREQHALVART